MLCRNEQFWEFIFWLNSTTIRVTKLFFINDNKLKLFLFTFCLVNIIDSRMHCRSADRLHEKFVFGYISLVKLLNFVESYYRITSTKQKKKNEKKNSWWYMRMCVFIDDWALADKSKFGKRMLYIYNPEPLPVLPRTYVL